MQRLFLHRIYHIHAVEKIYRINLFQIALQLLENGK